MLCSRKPISAWPCSTHKYVLLKGFSFKAASLHWEEEQNEISFSEMCKTVLFFFPAFYFLGSMKHTCKSISLFSHDDIGKTIMLKALPPVLLAWFSLGLGMGPSPRDLYSSGSYQFRWRHHISGCAPIWPPDCLRCSDIWMDRKTNNEGPSR